MKCPKCNSTDVEIQEKTSESSCSYFICNKCHHMDVQNHNIDKHDQCDDKLDSWQRDPDFWKK